MAESVRAEAPLRPWVLAAYGLPALPLACLLLPLYVYLPAYYAEDLGIGFAVVGAVLLAARLWDLLTDPLIGWLSDRVTTRWGRRRPWMIVGVPLLVLSAWHLFVPAQGTGWVGLLVWSLLFYLAGTMVLLPYSAWGAELSPDYHERSRITGVREALAVIGTLVAAGLPALLGADRAAGLTLIAWLFLLALPLAVAAATLLVPEPVMHRQAALGWRRGLALMRRNGPFRRLIGAYLLNGVANGLPASLFLLYVDHALRRDDLTGVLLFVYFLSGVLSVPFWLWLGRRLEKHRVWCSAMILACAVFVWVPFIGPGEAGWFVAVCVLTGLALGADLVLPPSMQADVVEFDRLRSGESRAGVYFALWGVATKLALALAVGLAFPLLDAAGLGDGAERPAGLALFALVGLYSLAPVAFKLASIALVWRFPIGAARQARIRARLDARSGALDPAGQPRGASLNG